MPYFLRRVNIKLIFRIERIDPLLAKATADHIARGEVADTGCDVVAPGHRHKCHQPGVADICLLRIA